MICFSELSFDVRRVRLSTTFNPDLNTYPPTPGLSHPVRSERAGGNNLRSVWQPWAQLGKASRVWGTVKRNIIHKARAAAQMLKLMHSQAISHDIPRIPCKNMQPNMCLCPIQCLCPLHWSMHPQNSRPWLVWRCVKKCLEHTHTYIHKCLHAYMPTCICIPAYMRVYILTQGCLHTCIHTFMHTHIHANAHTCAKAYVHTCTHTYLRRYIHTCIHKLNTCLHAYLPSNLPKCIHICKYVYAYIHTRFRTRTAKVRRSRMHNKLP